ncbi:MAG: hypothetical protein AB7G62_01290 [Magnetospirillum sp.]
MKLSPSEILTYLGFQVGPDGVDVNPVDAFAITTGLRLAGQVLASRLDAIPEDELKGMHDGMVGIAETHGLGIGANAPDFDAARTRQFVKLALKACGHDPRLS